MPKLPIGLIWTGIVCRQNARLDASFSKGYHECLIPHVSTGTQRQAGTCLRSRGWEGAGRGCEPVKLGWAAPPTPGLSPGSRPWPKAWAAPITGLWVSPSRDCTIRPAEGVFLPSSRAAELGTPRAWVTSWGSAARLEEPRPLGPVSAASGVCASPLYPQPASQPVGQARGEAHCSQSGQGGRLAGREGPGPHLGRSP